VGLLDLVEQHDGVGPTAHRLGELATLFVPDIAGRCTDETRDRVPLGVLLMSMRTIARSSSKRKSASDLASSVLPTPVGPRKRNEPVGRSGSASPARRAAHRVRDRPHGLGLADQAGSR
jgi:hypothetical protein